MKKVIFLLMALVMMGNMSFAQDKKAAKGTVAQKRIDKTEAMQQRKMKKDGTPDMRYKANKEGAEAEKKPAGPLKKDGTPDKRYKANKGTDKK